jgi:hypothetical protein
LFWSTARRDPARHVGGYDAVVHCVVAEDSCARAADIVTFDWWGGSLVSRPAAVADAQNRLHLLSRGGVEQGGLVRIYYSRAPAAQAERPDGWSQRTSISGSGMAGYSDLAIDQRTTLHAVWSDLVACPAELRNARCPGYSHVFYRHSTDGGDTWSAPTDITPTAQGAEKPHLVIGAQDAVHVVWEEGPGAYGCQDLRPVGSGVVSSMDDGAHWSSPTMFLWPNDAPQRVTAGFDGQRLVVVWGLLKAREVSYQVSADGGASWSAPHAIPGVFSRALENDLDTYDMAADPSGHLHLVLVGRTVLGTPETSSVLHVEWDGQAWLPAEVIVTVAGDVPEWPRLAMGPGNALQVIWFVRDQENVWKSDHARYRVWYAHRGAPQAAAVQ